MRTVTTERNTLDAGLDLVAEGKAALGSTLPVRRIRTMSCAPLAGSAGGGAGPPGPVGPFLEPGAAAVVAELHDPQVAVLLAGRIPVADLGPHDGGGAVDGQDVGGDGEDLIRAVSLLIPHPPDPVQASDRRLVRGLPVAGVAGEDLG